VGGFFVAFLLFGTSSLTKLVALPFHVRYFQPVAPLAAIAIALLAAPLLEAEGRPRAAPALAPTVRAGLVVGAFAAAVLFAGLQPAIRLGGYAWRAPYLAQLRDVAGNLGIAFLGLGASPKWAIEDTPVMPKGRYKIMRDYMPKVGRLGRQMMFRSCTVQTNLDFASEADMRKKMRVSLALQPIATALFANSPFMDGRPNGFLSYRAHIWTDTDPDRTGMLPFVFEEGFGFEQYVDYALDVPMYFVYRNGKYIDCAGMSFRDFLAGKLPALPGELPSMKDFEDHLTTIFPEVRLKTYIEQRGADAGPWSRLCALPAFWAGIFYCDAALEAAWSLVKSWTAEDREALRRSVPVLGLKAPIRGMVARDVAQQALAIARQGLKSRAKLNASGDDETHFLSELDDIAATGVTPAERLLERWRTEWKGDMAKVFEACAY
jgi:glutamate--cysteine ligase